MDELYAFFDQYKEAIKKDFINHALEDVVWYAYHRLSGGGMYPSITDTNKNRILIPNQTRLVTIDQKEFIDQSMERYKTILIGGSLSSLVDDLFEKAKNNFFVTTRDFQEGIHEWLKRNIDFSNLGAMMEGIYNYASQKGQERKFLDNRNTKSSEVPEILEQYKKEFKISKWKKVSAEQSVWGIVQDLLDQFYDPEQIIVANYVQQRGKSITVNPKNLDYWEKADIVSDWVQDKKFVAGLFDEAEKFFNSFIKQYNINEQEVRQVKDYFLREINDEIAVNIIKKYKKDVYEGIYKDAIKVGKEIAEYFMDSNTLEVENWPIRERLDEIKNLHEGRSDLNEYAHMWGFDELYTVNNVFTILEQSDLDSGWETWIEGIEEGFWNTINEDKIKDLLGTDTSYMYEPVDPAQEAYLGPEQTDENEAKKHRRNIADKWKVQYDKSPGKKLNWATEEDFPKKPWDFKSHSKTSIVQNEQDHLEYLVKLYAYQTVPKYPDDLYFSSIEDHEEYIYNMTNIFNNEWKTAPSSIKSLLNSPDLEGIAEQLSSRDIDKLIDIYRKIIEEGKELFLKTYKDESNRVGINIDRIKTPTINEKTIQQMYEPVDPLEEERLGPEETDENEARKHRKEIKDRWNIKTDRSQGLNWATEEDFPKKRWESSIKKSNNEEHTSENAKWWGQAAATHNASFNDYVFSNKPSSDYTNDSMYSLVDLMSEWDSIVESYNEETQDFIYSAFWDSEERWIFEEDFNDDFWEGFWEEVGVQHNYLKQQISDEFAKALEDELNSYLSYILKDNSFSLKTKVGLLHDLSQHDEEEYAEIAMKYFLDYYHHYVYESLQTLDQSEWPIAKIAIDKYHQGFKSIAENIKMPSIEEGFLYVKNRITIDLYNVSNGGISSKNKIKFLMGDKEATEWLEDWLFSSILSSQEMVTLTEIANLTGLGENWQESLDKIEQMTKEWIAEYVNSPEAKEEVYKTVDMPTVEGEVWEEPIDPAREDLLTPQEYDINEERKRRKEIRDKWNVQPGKLDWATEEDFPKKRWESSSKFKKFANLSPELIELAKQMAQDIVPHPLDYMRAQEESYRKNLIPEYRQIYSALNENFPEAVDTASESINDAMWHNLHYEINENPYLDEDLKQEIEENIDKFRDEVWEQTEPIRTKLWKETFNEYIQDISSTYDDIIFEAFNRLLSDIEEYWDREEVGRRVEWFMSGQINALEFIDGLSVYAEEELTWLYRLHPLFNQVEKNALKSAETYITEKLPELIFYINNEDISETIQQMYKPVNPVQEQHLGPRETDENEARKHRKQIKDKWKIEPNKPLNWVTEDDFPKKPWDFKSKVATPNEFLPRLYHTMIENLKRTAVFNWESDSNPWQKVQVAYEILNDWDGYVDEIQEEIGWKGPDYHLSALMRDAFIDIFRPVFESFMYVDNDELHSQFEKMHNNIRKNNYSNTTYIIDHALYKAYTETGYFLDHQEHPKWSPSEIINFYKDSPPESEKGYEDLRKNEILDKWKPEGWWKGSKWRISGYFNELDKNNFYIIVKDSNDYGTDICKYCANKYSKYSQPGDSSDYMGDSYPALFHDEYPDTQYWWNPCEECGQNRNRNWEPDAKDIKLSLHSILDSINDQLAARQYDKQAWLEYFPNSIPKIEKVLEELKNWAQVYPEVQFMEDMFGRKTDVFEYFENVIKTGAKTSEEWDRRQEKANEELHQQINEEERNQKYEEGLEKWEPENWWKGSKLKKISAYEWNEQEQIILDALSWFEDEIQKMVFYKDFNSFKNLVEFLVNDLNRRNFIEIDNEKGILESLFPSEEDFLPSSFNNLGIHFIYDHINLEKLWEVEKYEFEDNPYDPYYDENDINEELERIRKSYETLDKWKPEGWWKGGSKWKKISADEYEEEDDDEEDDDRVPEWYDIEYKIYEGFRNIDGTEFAQSYIETYSWPDEVWAFILPTNVFKNEEKFLKIVEEIKNTNTDIYAEQWFNEHSDEIHEYLSDRIRENFDYDIFSQAEYDSYSEKIEDQIWKDSWEISYEIHNQVQELIENEFDSALDDPGEELFEKYREYLSEKNRTIHSDQEMMDVFDIKDELPIIWEKPDAWTVEQMRAQSKVKKSGFEDWSTPETSILIDEILYDSRIINSPIRNIDKIVRKGGTVQDLANWLIENILKPYNEMVMKNWEEISDEQDIEAQKQELRRTWKQQARKQFPFSMQKQKQYVQEMEQMQFGLLGDPEPENIERYLLKVENIDWQEIYDWVKEDLQYRGKMSSHGQNQMAIGNEVAETTFEGVEVDPEPEPEEKIINGKKWKMVRPKPNKQPAEYARPKGGWGFYSKHKKSDLNDWTDSTKLAIEKIISDLPNKLKIRAAVDADSTVRDWIQRSLGEGLSNFNPYYDFNTNMWRHEDGQQMLLSPYEERMINFHNTETNRLIDKDQINLGFEQVRNMADVAVRRYDRFDQNLYWELGQLILDTFPGITVEERKNVEKDIYNIINERELESIYNDAYYEAWEKAFNEEVSKEESLINKNSKKDAWEVVLDGELGHDIITTGTWEEVKKQTLKWLKQLKNGYINKKNPHDNKKIDSDAKEQDGYAIEDLKLYDEEKRWSFHFDHGKHPYDLIIQPVGYKESKWKKISTLEEEHEEYKKIYLDYKVEEIKKGMPNYLYEVGKNEGWRQLTQAKAQVGGWTTNDFVENENNHRNYNPDQLTFYHEYINENDKNEKFLNAIKTYIVDKLEETRLWLWDETDSEEFYKILEEIKNQFNMNKLYKKYDEGFNLAFTQGPQDFYNARDFYNYSPKDFYSKVNGSKTELTKDNSRRLAQVSNNES